MYRGWVCFWRKFLDSSFYKMPLTCRLAEHLVLIANHKDKKIIINNKEVIIPRGSLITGRKKLSEETGISEQSIRTSLEILKKCNFLTIKSTSHFSIITICNYELYQDVNLQDNQESNQRVTSHQPTGNHKQQCNNVTMEQVKTNTETVVNPFIKAVTPSSVARDGKKNTANKNSGKNKIYANAIRGYEQYIQSDTHKLIDRLVASEGLYPDGLSESETIRIWAFAIQARIKRNPAGWFSNAISECQYPPSDEALALAKQEYYLQEQNYVDSEIASKISAFLQR